MKNRTNRTILALTALGLGAMMLTGCAAAGASAEQSPAGTPATALRLGYFANVTHAPALVGLQEGILQKDLGATKLTTQVFNAGPAAVEALSAGAIDAAYIGPSPAISTFVKSGGQSATVVAGVANGGAALVVREGISSPADLKGATLASPQLGNTQDVALRTWLKSQGYTTDTQGGGDVHVTPTENAQTLALFQQGKLDGAWVPEPWVSRLVLNGKGKVLVDEADLWKGGQFPTTVLLVSKQFLAEHPQTVKALVRGNADAIAFIGTNPVKAKADVEARLKADTGKALADAVLTRALEHVTFSNDPEAADFPKLLANGVAVGTAKHGDLKGLFDLRLLNEALKASGAKPVSADGLGSE